ncbi:unnamed protein product, partial [Mycena citricolor]
TTGTDSITPGRRVGGCGRKTRSSQAAASKVRRMRGSVRLIHYLAGSSLKSWFSCVCIPAVATQTRPSSVPSKKGPMR